MVGVMLQEDSLSSLEVTVPSAGAEEHLPAIVSSLVAGCSSNCSRRSVILCRLLAAGYRAEEWLRPGILTPAYLETINVHWTFYPPPPSWHHSVIICVFLALFVIGFTGNLLVMSAFIRRPSLRTPPLLLLMNLSVSDCLVSFKSLVVVINSWYQGPVLGLIGCELYGFASGAAGTSSILTLAAIARERARVIAQPLDLRRRLTRRQLYTRVAMAWTVALVFSGMPLTQVQGLKFVPEGYLTTCSFDLLSPSATGRFFTLIFVAAAWLMPTALITHAYITILVAVFKGSLMLQRECQQVHTALVLKSTKKAEVSHIKLPDTEWRCFSEQRRRLEIRLAKVSASCVLAWYASWTPYALVAVMGAAGFGAKITPLMTVIPGATAKLASCINPFIYCLFSKKFRREMELTLNCFRGRRDVANVRGQGRDVRSRRRSYALRMSGASGSGSRGESVVSW